MIILIILILVLYLSIISIYLYMVLWYSLRGHRLGGTGRRPLNPAAPSLSKSGDRPEPPTPREAFPWNLSERSERPAAMSVPRSLFQDPCATTLLHKPTLPAFRAMDMHHLRRGRTWKSEIATWKRWTRAPQRVALRNQKPKLYQHAAHSKRTISAEGCTSKSQNATLRAFCMRDRRVRSPQIEDCTSKPQNATLPAFPANRTHDLRKGLHFEAMLQKYCACHQIMSRGPTKRCTGHAKASSSSSKNTLTPLRNWALRPQNIWSMASMVQIPCARHVKRNPSNDTRLPTIWQRPRWNTAPATIFITCPIPCTCHVNSRFWPPHVMDSLHLHVQNEVHFRKCTRAPGKTMPSNCDFRDGSFEQACAVEINIESQNISKQHSCANEATRSERVP